jgi:hypothetical protein
MNSNRIDTHIKVYKINAATGITLLLCRILGYHDEDCPHYEYDWQAHEDHHQKYHASVGRPA